MSWSSIIKYVRKGRFPRYYFAGYKERMGSKEGYERAKKLYSYYTFLSSKFAMDIAPYIKTLLFPVSSEYVHPKYLQIAEKAEELKSVCAELYPDMSGVWSISRGGKFTGKEKKLVSDRCSGEASEVFSVRCNESIVCQTCLLYAYDDTLMGVSRVARLSAELIKLVSYAQWLTMSTWDVIMFSSEDSKNVVVMCDTLYSYYITAKIYGRKALGKYDVATGNAVVDFTPEEDAFGYYSLTGLISKVSYEKRKQSTTEGIIMSRSYALPKLNLGTSAVISSDSIVSVSKASTDRAGEMGISDCMGLTGVSSAVIDVDEPVYRDVQEACKGVLEVIEYLGNGYNIGDFLYISRIPCSCCSHGSGYGFYCDGELLGDVRCLPNLCSSMTQYAGDVLNDILSIVLSLPVCKNFTGNIALPCSSVVRRNFGDTLVLVNDRVLDEMRLFSKNY